MSRSPRNLPSHIAAFVAGGFVASAVLAHAIPRSDDGGRGGGPDRYATLDTFAQALSQISNNYVEPVAERKLIYGAISGMLERLDEHSRFLSPRRYERLRQDTQGEFGGVGLALTDDEDEEANHAPMVESVVPNSPAARAGIRVGDRLLAINGRSTVSPGKERRAEYWHSRLRGRSGTRITLDVVRTTWPDPRSLVLVRERVKVPTVNSLTLEPGIGYIAVHKFQDATATDVQAALRTLDGRGLHALILDLRGNPGGILDQAVAVADLFLADGLIVTVRGRRGARVEHEYAHRPGSWSDILILVLIDKGSASAAEIVAAALQDQGRATVMGTPSFGKGSVQTFIDLPDGSGLKLTTAHYYTPAGRTLERSGITPDIHVEADDDEDSPDAEPGMEPTDSQGRGQGSRHGPRSGSHNARVAVELVTDPSLRLRLTDDRQLQTAFRTVRQWLGTRQPNRP